MKRPYLRKRFFVRRHRGWGAAVCWYCKVNGKWGINWGIGCKTMREAKVIRKFLNERVKIFPNKYGTAFADTVRFVLHGRSDRESFPSEY